MDYERGNGATYQFVTCRFARVGVARAARAEANVLNCIIDNFISMFFLNVKSRIG